ncbi:MAG: hypothetical protein KAW12_11415 [Candidatus Aminicenantes bacterium]|nr:hypothetical protein [Candidatus Aminicenantes bacterium]
MKESKVKQIFRQLLIAVVFFSLICPGNLWAKKEKVGATIVVTKVDGQEVKGELLKVKNDSLLLLVPESLAKVTIGIDEIDTIFIKSKSKKGNGGLLGLVAGGAVGFLLVNSALQGVNDGSEGIFPVVAGVGCAAVGFIIGSGLSRAASKSKTYRIKGKFPIQIKSILKKLNKKARFWGRIK